VERAIDLGPDHVSFYLLELYPNAPLRESIARGGPADGQSLGQAGVWQQEGDDEAADMYLDGLERLDAAGYSQYEISNVARAGRASRHNLKYWTMGSWRGFGCGAHSTVDGVRWRNVSGTADYIQRLERGEPVAIDRREQSAAERSEEAIFTGLRLTAGLDAAEVAARYGRNPLDMYGEDLAVYADAGLLWKAGTRIGLTRSGMLVSNEMLARFV
jgi:oxygen-independent coproporphyrinogen-3 oxidase